MVKISVVCPTYNSAKFIEGTLETVVTQSRLPDEVVISDDGSSDDTLAVVERFAAERGAGIVWRILRNAHHGPGATRNAGISAAGSDWIAFLDSDDLWETNKIAVIAKAIEAAPEANFFSHDELLLKVGGATSVLEYGRRYRAERPLPPQLYFSNMFSTSAVVCRRDLLVQHGCFDETLMSAQDYELWLRLSPAMRPVFVHEVLGRYVERAGNITSSGLKRRFRNEVRIAMMHREKVSAPWVLVRVGRVAMSYARQFARAKFAS
jgi:glycosyltransferase involved in cell wall biosynthesis